MGKKKRDTFLITILLALMAVAGQAQTNVWNKIVTGYVNVPFINITKVSIYDDHTEVFFHLEVPQQMAGDTIPIATKPILRADGKDYAAKGATVISLTEPYIIPADGMGERYQGVQRQRPERGPFQPAQRPAGCHRAPSERTCLAHLQTLRPQWQPARPESGCPRP